MYNKNLEKKKKKVPENGQNDGQVVELLNQHTEMFSKMMQKLQDHDAQFAELEKGQDAAGQAKLLVSKLVYDPTRKQLPGMTVLSYRAVDPFGLAMVCGSIMSPEVRNGEVSLGDIYMESVERLLRSVKGKTLDLAAEHARTQEVEKVEEYGAYESANLGKGL